MNIETKDIAVRPGKIDVFENTKTLRTEARG